MDFKKNEIIVLGSGTKHIIVDTTEYENKYYYYVAEVNEEEEKVKNNIEVITTVTENGNIFVKRVKGELENILMDMFNNKNNK